MTGNRTMRVAHLVAMFLLVAFMPPVYALSCDSKPVELAFDNANQVFLARIISAEILYTEEAERGRIQAGVRHQFEIVEIYKGEIDFASFETDLAWGRETAHFAVGDTNLFFMEDDRAFDSCSPKYLLGQEDTAAVLRKLRDLKKGVFNTVSGAWATTVREGHCSIYTTYLLEGSTSTVSFSIGHSVETESSKANSNVWVYSYSKTGAKTVDRSGLTLTYEKQAQTIPFANGLLDNGANFYSKIDHVDRLLGAVLAEEPVFLEGSTRSDSKVEIPLLLNGGTEAIREFAHCGNLVLNDDR